MIQRGRPSRQAKLTKIDGDGIGDAGRPEPPPELSPEMAGVWKSVVAREPAGFFTSAGQIVLVQLCRHTIAARRLAELLASEEAADRLGHSDRLRLMLAQRSESQTIKTLATSLRLTAQARYHTESAATAARNAASAPGRMPWDDPI